MRVHFSQRAEKGLKSSYLSELEKKSEQLFENYYKNKRGFHDFLIKNNEMTPDQFRIIRDNFLYRTLTTRNSVEKVLLSSQKNQDESGARLAGLNLSQEDGENIPGKAHKKLMIKAWSAYGTSIMLEKPLDSNEQIIEERINKSNYLLDAVKQYRIIQNDLYSSPDHIIVIATSYAQESVAENMLKMFYETMFVPQKHKFEERGIDFSAVSEYFSVHLDGTEEEHAQNAKTVLEENCKTPQDINKAVSAIEIFLNAQSALWNSMDKKLRSIAPKHPAAETASYDF